MTALLDTSERISWLAPAGFYIALRVGFTFPSEEMNHLPDDWVDFYTRNGLVLHDPVMKWIYSNTGVVRWSELTLPDPAEVKTSAQRYGLTFGAATSALSPSDQGRRSYGIFFRADREFEPLELASLQTIVLQLHSVQGQDLSLTAAEIEALKLQSSGMRLKQIAAALGISESAVKARLKNAKRKLGAKTPSQAASIAAARRLL